MLFKPEMCPQILKGSKTQTRRLVHPLDYCSGIGAPRHKHEVRQVWRGNQTRNGEYLYASWPTKARLGRLKWEVGRTYAVQPGRGKKSIGRVRLLSIRRERLQDISDEDVIAEGLRWHDDHIGGFRVGDKYYHLPAFAFAALWNSINVKKGTRWQDNPSVWCLEFEPA